MLFFEFQQKRTKTRLNFDGTSLSHFLTMSNISIVSEPAQFIIDFFYYYSFLTMFISWGIAPILFYTILTQSKSLGACKWLLLNYSFWGLCMSTFMGIVKPIIVTPAFCIYHIGLFRRHGSYLSTLALTAILLTFATTCMGGMVATMGYRYFMVFPSILKDWFTLRKAIIFTFLLPSIAYLLISIVLIQMSHISTEEAYIWAEETDPMLLKYTQESSFFIAPHFAIDAIGKITSLILVGTHFGALGYLIFLRLQMIKYANLVSTKVNRGIIISVVVQGCVNMFYLISPYTFVIAALGFQIPQSASITVLLECAWSSYCIVDYLSTLCLITPYRTFLIGIIKKKKLKISFIQPVSSSLQK